MHPETWNPSHTFSSIMLSLISFMVENNSTRFAGSTTSTLQARRRMALESDGANERAGLYAGDWTWVPGREKPPRVEPAAVNAGPPRPAKKQRKQGQLELKAAYRQGDLAR